MLQKVSQIETNQIEGLTLAIIIVLEFPPSESCIIFNVKCYIITSKCNAVKKKRESETDLKKKGEL